MNSVTAEAGIPGKPPRMPVEYPVRFMGVDCGSNSIKYRVWEISKAGAVEQIKDKRFSVRLGAGVFSGGQVDAETKAALLEVFAKIADEIERRGVRHIRAVATSAMREATNGPELASAIQTATGIKLEIVSDETEARLIGTGTIGRLPGELTGPMMLIDIGGGSTEVIAARQREIVAVRSLPLGAVRLRQKFFTDFPATADQITAARKHIREEVDWQIDAAVVHMHCEGLGMSGTITALNQMTALMMGKKGADTFTLEELDAIIEEIIPLKPEKIEKRYYIDERRSEIILPGALVLHEIMSTAALPQIQLVAGGVGDGLLHEFLQSLEL